MQHSSPDNLTENDSFPLRLFLAIPLWNDLPIQSRDVYDQLRRTVHEPLKWVAPSLWHITLYFLGNVSKPQLDELLVVLPNVAAECNGFELSLRRLGGFPRLSRARVLWVGTETGEKPLKDLAGKIKTVCEQTSLRPDRKHFQPHLTLARSKQEPVTIRIPENLLKTHWGTVQIDSFALVKSTLKPNGPVYEVIKEYPLSTKPLAT